MLLGKAGAYPFGNKLEHLSLASLSSLVYFLRVRSGAYPSESPFRGQCYKNTVVNYCSNFNPSFCRVKMMQNITAISGYIMLYNIGYTNSIIIYCHSTVITKVMLLYNKE
jgi:hypothetical protein